jgi:hypothetical protein
MLEDDDALFSFEVGSALKDENQRLFWSEYLDKAAAIIGGKDVDGPWDKIIQDDISSMENMITKKEFPTDKEAQKKLMTEMLAPYVKGRVRAEIKAGLSEGPKPTGRTAKNPNTGQVLREFEDGSWK